jgi:hypothetical protein
VSHSKVKRLINDYLTNPDEWLGILVTSF